MTPATPQPTAPEAPKHFPAPWWIDGRFDAECSVEILSGDPNDRMNALTVFEVEPFGEDWTEAEIAHVHIAAASLDLLTACKRLLAAPHHEHFGVRLNNEEMAGLDAIKAAVAKAEGRSL